MRTGTWLFLLAAGLALAACGHGHSPYYSPTAEVARPLNHYQTVTVDPSLEELRKGLRAYDSWCSSLPDRKRTGEGITLAWTDRTSAGKGFGTPWLVVRLTPVMGPSPGGGGTEAAFYTLYPEGKDWADDLLAVLENPRECRAIGTVGTPKT